jgi:hypothetical protein
VPVSGGLSGARVWRGDSPTGSPVVAVKGWPPGMTARRLAAIHLDIDRAAHLPFVPRLLRTEDGDTVVTAGEQVWDATQWRPGRPAELLTPQSASVMAEALARLHEAWPATRVGPCPGVRNRLRALEEFERSFPTVPAWESGVAAELVTAARRAWWAVSHHRRAVTAALRRWEPVRFALGPCLRDVRWEHVLFEDGRVSGIVDYGALAEDHVAVDLARYLGDSPAANSEEVLAAAAASYRQARGRGRSTAFPDEFLRDLTRAGVVCSLIGWLVRLRPGGGAAVPTDAAGVAARIERLLDRVGASGPT